jgi:hypothetical protein
MVARLSTSNWKCFVSQWFLFFVMSRFWLLLPLRCMRCATDKKNENRSEMEPFLNNKSYLVDPASNICLSQRLSHACLSINNFILWNCVQLIISAIIYLMVPYYMDNRGNSRANTCAKSRLSRGGMYLLDKKPMRALSGFVLNHSNFSDGIALRWPQIIQISALSAFDGSVVDYRGVNG